MWRAQYALLGKPPNVLPWHPLWSDYRRILEELTPFLKDRKQRLLMVSNTPTVFTVSLSDSGERVHRLRGTPFLQSAPERFTSFFGRFDLCLVELSEGEMELGGELIDRIAPLMKADGRIIVSVLNRRSIVSAHEFGKGVSHHGSRFIRSGAVPTEIHFVRASRLRWAANRGMLSLRTAVSKTPWLGIPSMLVGGALLMALSLLGNLDGLRRTKRIAPRGIASSLLMRLRVDARNARNVHPFSQFQARRRELLKRRLEAASRKPKDADASWDISDTTRGPQYSRSVELKNTIGLTPLGMLANQIWHDDPQCLAFLLARYKFVAKMLNGRHDVGEVGCGDAFGARIVLQEVDKVSVYDPDRIFVEDVRARHDDRWPLQAHIHDIIESPLPRRHDALFSLDNIEYLTPKDEHAYIANLRGSLTDDGVLIIGTRSLESQPYASSSSKAERRNCKSGQELKVLFEQYFSRVFVFSMNDEVVHTGFYPMAQYLFVMCTAPK
jgi:hypothetical protein